MLIFHYKNAKNHNIFVYPDFDDFIVVKIENCEMNGA